MEPSDKDIQKIKDGLEKEHGRNFTWEEATEAMWHTKRLAEISANELSEGWRWQELLKEHPKGFHLDVEGYSCQICDSPASGTNSWFDKYGLKCMTCQKAINDKVIPAAIAKDKRG